VEAALGHGEKRRIDRRAAVEDDEASAALTQAREAVRRLGDDGKAAVVKELSGGGARARRGEEDTRDGCGEGWARASAFYRVWRELEAPGTQWPALDKSLEPSELTSSIPVSPNPILHTNRIKNHNNDRVMYITTTQT
jgi:hypothetical protein